jgi:hypothetical protein
MKITLNYDDDCDVDRRRVLRVVSADEAWSMLLTVREQLIRIRNGKVEPTEKLFTSLIDDISETQLDNVWA